MRDKGGMGWLGGQGPELVAVHLSDDEAVAKMEHPGLWGTRSGSKPTSDVKLSDMGYPGWGMLESVGLAGVVHFVQFVLGHFDFWRHLEFCKKS